MLDINALFDERYYLAQNPDVAVAVVNGLVSSALQHFQQFGQFEGRDPGALFDTDFYLELYPDVASVVESGQTTAIQHFVNSGQLENRNAIAEFSTDFYLAQNPDIAAAVQRDELSGYQHFVQSGQYEGRDPNPDFNTSFYLQKNPDVAAVLSRGGLSPIKHFIEFGQAEGRLSDRITHPLEPLNLAEIKAAVSVVRQTQNLSSSALFPNVSLQEPSKDEVLKFTEGSPFKREASVTVLDREPNKIYEAIVDIDTRQLTSWKEVTSGQPAILASEFEELSNIVKADPRWQEAMRKRGITNFDEVVVDGWAPGNLSSEERASGARLIRGLSYYKGDKTNFYGGSIEGVLATVNLNNGTLVDFIDTGAVPFSRENFDFDAESVGQLRDTPKPLSIEQPDGTSFEIDNNEINWQNWNFRYTMHPRDGLVLHQVSYQDGGEVRPILYRAGLSEMVVPYADTDRTWTFRNAFDVGEYGLGRLANTMEPGREVPENAVLLDAVFADDFGEPYVQPQVIGVYERDSGLLWQHYDYVTGEVEGRMGRELVLTSIATVGNYDYGIDWIFQQDGTIEVEAHLTGILLPKGTAATSEDSLSDRDRYGTLVAKNVLAPNHQHFFNFRLDMDVDGTDNSAFEMNTNAVPANQNNPARNGFAEEETLLETEALAQRDLDWKQHREWEIVNASKENSLGGDIGYTLEPGENSVPYASPESSIRQRAGFIDHQAWVTQYKPGEMYAAGDYPNQSTGGQGLTQWVKDNESLVGKDIVLWYTMGVTHIPRPEDWPIMPVETAGFKLMPTGFFTKNPALDVPPPEKS